MRTPRPASLVLLSFALVLAGLLPFAHDVRAVPPPESDIPGIPLPGAVVTGQLGGPIYDVVYRVDVPAGYVIVAGLAGTPGTDFDMYLFDASATTVIGTSGLLTKSTGPTSDEHVSWPTRIGGTFYLDLNGASDQQGSYTLSVQIVPDPTPPTAVLVVANGVTRVSTPEVTLQLAGFDDISGVTEMLLSNDGVNFLPPVPFRNQFDWKLSPGDGLKTIWVSVINGVGLASVPVSAIVLLDAKSPTVLSVDPEDRAVVGTPRPVISVRFSEPMDVSTWTNLGLIVQSATGAIVPGRYAYNPSMQAGTFTPSVDLAAGYVYFATVGDVRDLAGNRVSAPSWTLKYLHPTAISVTTSARLIVTGSSITLSGSASIPPGENLQLDAREGGSLDYTAVGPIELSGGRYSITLTPAMNTYYRVSHPGSAVANAASAETRVIVRSTVSLLGTASSVSRTAKVGRPVTLTAQVAPAGVRTVSFQRYRYDTRQGRWVYAGSNGRSTNEDGQASLIWTPPSAGRWYVRAAVLPSPEFANNLSAVYRYTVSR